MRRRRPPARSSNRIRLKLKFSPAFSKRLRGIKGGGAPFCSALRAALCAMRSQKPCQPKTAKRFFGGPGSHGPSGQAKERTRILPGAMCRAGRSCAACRFCAGLCDRCPGVCSLLQSWRPCVRLAAIVSAFCGVVFRPTRRLPLLRPACAAPPGPACRLSAVRRGHRIFCCFFHAQPTESSSFFAGVPRLCSRPAGPVACCFFADLCAHCLFACSALFMRVFLLSFALFCLTFASQKSFHLSLRPRRASTFFRKESRQRFAKGLRPFEPHGPQFAG